MKGKKYDQKKPPMHLISTKALVGLADVLGYGEQKYSAQNWRSGIAWSRNISAALRHLLAFNDGIDIDVESGLPHVDHAFCCLMFLCEYYRTHKHLDDRYKPKKRRK